MKMKLGLIVGLAAGYVLGARAGHERYEELKQQAKRVWKSDEVQSGLAEGQQFVQDKAPVVKEKVEGAASTAASAAKDKSRDIKDTAQGNPGSDFSGADLQSHPESSSDYSPRRVEYTSAD